jgi:serine phosphatase RsbU (regulator of sigma subunit)
MVDLNVAVVAGIEVPAPLPVAPPHSATAAEIAQYVALRAAACVGADFSNVALLDQAGASLRLFHGSYSDRGLTEIPIEAPYPIAAAARTGDAIVLSSRTAYQERFPELLKETLATGIQAAVSLPLYREDGSAVGAIGFAWTDPPKFDLRLENALRAVAKLCTEIVERAERYDAEHQLVVDLHNRMLEDLPQHARINLAARYLPAGRPAFVGGDWYEGIVLGDDRIAVVVGDVNGHGISAAADMALIRGMVSALLHSGVEIADVFTQVSEVLLKRSGQLLATAALAVIDVAAETLTFATAGHPPPLVVRPDGSVQVLDTANAPMLGIVATRNIAETIEFPPGSQLVVYTDGMIERRGRTFFDGVDLAVAHLAALPTRLGADELIDSILDALVGDSTPDDDIAVVVVDHLL